MQQHCCVQNLVVFGVPADRFYAAVAAVIGLSDVFKVDLVHANACMASLRQAIHEEGINFHQSNSDKRWAA